jgi:hypothetical protein
MTGYELHNARAGQGAVLVDVDTDTGAMILFAPHDIAGAEIEASRVLADGADGPRRHVAVLPRRLGGEVVHAAVYPSLPAGRWRLWSPDGEHAVLDVDVPGGRVVEARWPSTPPSSS